MSKDCVRTWKASGSGCFLLPTRQAEDQRCAAVQHMLSTDPSYDNRTIASTLKMQIWIATNNRDVPRVKKTKFPATVMVFGVVSSEGHIMPPYFVPFSHWSPSSPELNPLDYFVWSYAENITTWSSTTPKPAWSPPSAEYSPSSRQRLWKRHAPSSGSVSRRWLRLKAATLNRCHLYYIIKLAELIFPIKVLK